MTGLPVAAYVALGSNLHEPVLQVRAALRLLDDLPQTRLVRQSALYRSAPLGPPDQPDYVNAVALLETRLAPFELLDGLQAIEQRQGRVRNERWGPRVIDLDLLLYGDHRIVSERLTVPHPGIAERAFVLVPLHDVAPDGLLIPGIGLLADLHPGRLADQLRPVDG